MIGYGGMARVQWALRSMVGHYLCQVRDAGSSPAGSTRARKYEFRSLPNASTRDENDKRGSVDPPPELIPSLLGDGDGKLCLRISEKRPLAYFLNEP